MIKTMARHVAGLTFAAVAVAAQAQGFPSKPITLVVPFAPGASADGIARVVGKELGTALGQPVVVDNKPGAGGALGLMAVAKSPADGYTIGLGATGAIAVNPHLPDAPPLKPEKDLQPLAKLADIPLVFVTSTQSGYGNLQAFLNAARKAPSGLSYGTAGQYTAQHLSGELLASMAKAPLVPVPYRGSGPAVTDLLGGNVPSAMVDLTSAYPHIKAGKLVALGVTSATRSKVAPELPTIAEEGVTGYAAPAWMGLFLPAKTPADVASKLSAALEKVMANPAVQGQITALAAEPAYADGPAFGKFIAGESRKWADVVSRIPAPAK
ncbi:Bug family tripartite tricarboxylate transporter substrate binding protein [Ramlibacter algicola]|uniref:Tripartite tricarboxylate transporter substrate binding protein n=1 Tax=Ramlibacter algicola TaxID=2795217 RepID=A0A934PY47_9BURK|nr:tripartite tricarboxylate transporter substrate binding protein [Ramlibacter algicola]MBK0392629.1 tripartite tricarboxylate transporter substrate binding protein [Ramlibacter algicola]